MKSLLRVAVVACLPLAGVSAAPLADQVPLEVFAELPPIEGAELSPDGTRLAAKMNVNGKMMLVVRSLLDASARPAMLEPGDIDVNWWRWVGNDWLAVGLGGRDGPDGMYISRILGVSADMSKVNQIGWRQAGQDADDLLWVSRGGEPEIVFAKQMGFGREQDWYPSVYRANLATGQLKLVTSSYTDIWSWYADGQGNVRLGVPYSNKTIAPYVRYRQSDNEDFRTVRLPVAKWDEAALPFMFLPEGKALAFDDSTGRKSLHEFDLSGMRVGKMLIGDEKYDIDAVLKTGDNSGVEGARIIKQKATYVWLNPQLKAAQDVIDGSADPGNGHILDYSADRSKLMVAIGTPSQAGGLFYWDQNAGGPKQIAWVNPKLQNRTMSPVKSIRYAARDGTEIEAVLTLPRGRAARNLPLIVMPHGGPAARDEESFDWQAQSLAEVGYAVIQPNYRGSTGYGSAFQDLGKGQWGRAMQDDLLDAIAWTAREGIADPKRVCIVGGSYGGYAAIRAAQRDGAHYRCAVSFAGVADLPAMRGYDRAFLLGDEASSFWKDQASNLKEVSPRFGAASFSVPLLLVHGVKDKRVPVKQSRLMAEELRKAGKTVDYIEQPEGDHHFSRAEDRLQFLQAMHAFVAKHNPAS